MKNKFLWYKLVPNKEKKWFEFWKSDFVREKYYLIVENGFVVLGDMVITKTAKHHCQKN